MAGTWRHVGACNVLRSRWWAVPEIGHGSLSTYIRDHRSGVVGAQAAAALSPVAYLSTNVRRSVAHCVTMQLEPHKLVVDDGLY